MQASQLSRWLVLLATLLGVFVTSQLGRWQLDRAAQKKALQLAFESRAALNVLPQEQLASSAQQATAQYYRAVRLRGHWLAERTVYLDNRQMNGRAGFFVVTPLLVAGRAVLVQRGWVARNNDQRTLLPPLHTPAGEIEVQGRIVPPPARLYEFAKAASGPIRQNLDVDSYAGEIGVALRPLSVIQSAGPENAADGLLRQWPPPAVDIDKHYGYAFQWWALCALMIGLYAWFQLLHPWLRRSAR